MQIRDQCIYLIPIPGDFCPLFSRQENKYIEQDYLKSTMAGIPDV